MGIERVMRRRRRRCKVAGEECVCVGGVCVRSWRWKSDETSLAQALERWWSGGRDWWGENWALVVVVSGAGWCW